MKYFNIISDVMDSRGDKNINAKDEKAFLGYTNVARS